MKDFDSRLTVLEKQLRTLLDKPEETPESTLRALWMTAAGSPMSVARSLKTDLPELDSRQSDGLDRLISRRLLGEPLGHITQRQSFMGLEFVVGPDALLPRCETEILGKAAVAVIRGLRGRELGPLVIDTCCGCGNVALAVANSNPDATVVGIDLSPEAVELAQTNAERLGLTDRVEFRVGDLLAPAEDLAGEADLITCNPPYISSANVPTMDDEIASHEPAMAFDGGPFGVKILRRLVKEAPAFLRSHGILAFEVGLGQGEPMSDRLKKLRSYSTVDSYRDPSGAIRAIVTRVA